MVSGSLLTETLLIFNETANAHTIIPIAKYITAVYPYENAIVPAITGPTTVAMDKVELNIPVEVDLGLCAIK